MKRTHLLSRSGLSIAAALWGFSITLPALADPAICDRAARRAAQAEGVPPEVLLAITRTETGRSRNGVLEPWPWTVNMEGKGRWFETPDAAMRYVFERFTAGARSFDVGCFQINYKWHGGAFRSIEEMFDPEISADYAAALLARNFEKTSDWSQAAGTYHSRTPVHAARYRARFDEVFASLSGFSAPSEARAGPSRNGYPLLRGSGQDGGLGSLVPLSDSGNAAFLGLTNRESL